MLKLTSLARTLALSIFMAVAIVMSADVVWNDAPSNPTSTEVESLTYRLAFKCTGGYTGSYDIPGVTLKSEKKEYAVTSKANFGLVYVYLQEGDTKNENDQWVINTPGTYTVHFPAGIIKKNANEYVDPASPEKDYVFTIAKIVKQEITPAPNWDVETNSAIEGVTLEAPISNVNIVFPQVSKVTGVLSGTVSPTITTADSDNVFTVNGKAQSYSIKMIAGGEYSEDDDEDNGSTTDTPTLYADGDNYVKLTVTPALRYAGTYTFNFPENSLLIGSTRDPMEGFSFAYNLDESPIAPNITVTPAPGTVKTLSEVTVAYSGVRGTMGISGIDDASGSVKVPLMSNGEKVAEGTLSYVLEEGNPTNAFKVVFNPAVELDGDYELVISDNLVSSVSALYGGYSLNYTIENIKAGKYTATPSTESNQKTLDKIYLQFSNVTKLALSDNAELLKVTATKDDVALADDIKVALDDASENTVVIDLGKEYTDWGTYKFEIPTGAIIDQISGENFKLINKITLTYVIAEETSEVTVDPTTDYSYETLSGNVKVTYTEYSSIAAKGDKVEVTITDGASYNKTVETTAIEGNVLTITLPEEITVEGKFTFSVPYGQLTGVKTDATESNDVYLARFTYDIYGLPVPVVVTADPAPGEVEKLMNFTLTYEGSKTLAVTPEYAPSDLPVLRKMNGTEVEKTYKTYMPVASGNTVSFKVMSASEVITPGNYVLYVPETFMVVNGEHPTEALEFEYVIKDKAVEIPYTVTFTPEPGTVESLLTIITSFTSEDGVTVTRDHYTNTYPKLYRLDESGNRGTVISGAQLKGEGVFTWAPYYDDPTDGDYEWVIPAGYITFENASGDKATNKEEVAKYTVLSSNSVKDLFTSDTTYTVYNVAGVCLLKNADADAIASLPAGLYVINGKKILLH